MFFNISTFQHFNFFRNFAAGNVQTGKKDIKQDNYGKLKI